LNGEWDYSLNSGIVKPKYKRKIIVPFPIESPLSGVKKKILQPGMKLWYRKIVDLTKIKNNGRFLLHFGAVDQFTEVFINKNKVGEHDGGYTSFYFDITNYINKNLDKTEIVVKVKDNYSKEGAAFGKQGKPRTHTFYAQTGGI
jgi:beta-galactosidase/beta-glucuronidase